MLPDETVQIEEPIPSYASTYRGSRSQLLKGRFSVELRLKPTTWLLLALIAGAMFAIALLTFSKLIF